MARVFKLPSRQALSRLGIDYEVALNEEQRAVALANRGPLLVQAGAGSGALLISRCPQSSSMASSCWAPQVFCWRDQL